MEADIPDLATWLVTRQAAIDQLKTLVEDLNKYEKGSNVAGVVGTLTAIGGAVFGLGALALTPVSGGATLVPGVIAVSTSLSGTGTALGGKLLNKRQTKKKLKEVESIFENDKKSSESIQTLIQQVEQAEIEIADFLEELVKARVTEECLSDLTIDASQAVAVGQSGANTNSGTIQKPVNLKVKAQTSSKNDLMGMLKFAPRIVSGIRMARQLNLLNVNRLLNIPKTVLSPVFESLPQLGAGTGATAGTLARTGTRLLQVGKVVRYGGVVVSIVLLPIDAYNLVKTSLELKKGSVHAASKPIQDQIKDLEDEMTNVKDYLQGKITEINNFVILMNSILTEGCGEDLGSLINQILKRLLVLKNSIKAFDVVDVHTHAPFKDDRNSSNLSAVLVNCEGTDDSLYKRLSTFIWCAWIMGQNTVILLQNTALTEDPVLWTLFGVSISSFNTINGQGISVLLPINSSCDIVSTHEYQSTDRDWNGRCLVVNMKYQGRDYSFVSLLAPEEKLSRDLFIKEMSTFVKQNSIGKIFLGANFRLEEQTMTVVVRYRVSKNLPYSVIRRLIPYKDISEYLLQKLPGAERPMMITYQVLKKYSLIKSQDVDIKWNNCGETQVSMDSYRDQLKPLTKLGLVGLWSKKNLGCVEFSVEREVSERVVNCSQNLDFFINRGLDGDITDCYLDHTLRFLGFLRQSALFVRAS